MCSKIKYDEYCKIYLNKILQAALSTEMSQSEKREPHSEEKLCSAESHGTDLRSEDQDEVSNRNRGGRMGTY